jgi:hypothetical protein
MHSREDPLQVHGLKYFPIFSIGISERDVTSD